MNANAAEDDDLPAEIDFSGATRGKFYRPGARLNLPLYLDLDVQTSLTALAAGKVSGGPARVISLTGRFG
jgi:hypothetical protein